MGTRADFYVGRGSEAEWLGSIALDGYPEGVFDHHFAPTDCGTVELWREKVAAFLDRDDRATLPEQGWPWPWDDSRTTDYAYAWDDGTIYGSGYGHAWFVVDPAAEEFGESEDDEAGPMAVFPNMADRKAVTYGPRSGLIVIGLTGGTPWTATDAAPQPIDGATALRLLREVVAERPGHVYQPPGEDDGESSGCVYVWRGKPSCLIAHVLARAGWTVEQIADLDSVGAVVSLADKGFTIGDADAVAILDAAQTVQDIGEHTWAEALAAAEEKAAQLEVTV
jgi:hypothetical protein